MKKVKLGFIGTGEAAKTIHLPAVQALPEMFEITNVCSRNVTKCKEFSEMAGSSKYCTDYHELLEDPNVDAVISSIPFEKNHRLMREALKARKHIMLEKPLAASMEEAEEMVKWSQETSLVTMCAENFRYRDAVRLAKDEYIDKGVIGKPTVISYLQYLNFERDSHWIVNCPWRFTCKGGVILDRFVHWVAVVRELMGDAKYAVGYGGKMRDDFGPYDYNTLNLVFENGGTGVIHDVASVTGIDRREILVVGTEGSIAIENFFQRLHITNTSGYDVIVNLNDRTKSHRAEFSDFYHCICTGEKPRASIYEGYKDLQLALKAIEGAEAWKTLVVE